MKQSSINESAVTPSKSIFINMAVSAWETQNKRINDLLAKLSDEQLLSETAPGRNTGHYLLGHLTAISDAMRPILGWGDRRHLELDEAFVNKPDKSGLAMPSAQELRKLWNEVNDTVATHIQQMSPDEWFARHSLVSEPDFQAQPHRNKLNVLINRTNHHSYHFGQMMYLQKK